MSDLDYNIALMQSNYAAHKGQASIAVGAFNDGLAYGQARERERVIRIIQTEANNKQSALATATLIELLHLINDRTDK